MRTFFGIAAAMGIFTAVCLGQDSQADQKKAMLKTQIDVDQMLRGAKIIGVEAAIMGPAVKGQPYSAEEIHETTQVLADGTRIHNETKTTVYRDSQGRVRRESPGQVMIWDSAGHSSYILNQGSQTAQKMQMGINVIHKGDVSDGTHEFRTFQFPGGGAGGSDGAMTQRAIVIKNDQGGVAAAGPIRLKEPDAAAAKRETLPSQIIEGMNCDGQRLTTTIDANTIGNDRPIQTVEERWYSPELQVNMMVKRTDPRTGEDIVRLTNVRRVEPDPSLFTIPPTYQMK